MSKRASLTAEQAAADYNSGMTVREIAAKHKVSPSLVSGRLREAGVEVRRGAPRKNISPEQLAQGSEREAAKEGNVSRATIGRRRREKRMDDEN